MGDRSEYSIESVNEWIKYRTSTTFKYDEVICKCNRLMIYVSDDVPIENYFRNLIEDDFTTYYDVVYDNIKDYVLASSDIKIESKDDVKIESEDDVKIESNNRDKYSCVVIKIDAFKNASDIRKFTLLIDLIINNIRVHVCNESTNVLTKSSPDDIKQKLDSDSMIDVNFIFGTVKYPWIKLYNSPVINYFETSSISVHNNYGCQEICIPEMSIIYDDNNHRIRIKIDGYTYTNYMLDVLDSRALIGKGSICHPKCICSKERQYSHQTILYSTNKMYLRLTDGCSYLFSPYKEQKQIDKVRKELHNLYPNAVGSLPKSMKELQNVADKLNIPHYVSLSECMNKMLKYFLPE